MKLVLHVDLSERIKVCSHKMPFADSVLIVVSINIIIKKANWYCAYLEV